MKPNDIIQLKTIDMLDDGGAIAKIEGLPIFLDSSVIGDTVEAKITKIKKNYIQATVLDIIEPSLIRNPKKICSIQNKCGGCQIMDIRYVEQLKIKENLLLQKLERIGQIHDVKINKIVSMDTPYRYRNKSQMPVGKTGKTIQIGFYKRKSHTIIPFDDCKIQKEINTRIADICKEFIEEMHLSVYNESKHAGCIRHIITKISHTKNQIMLILVTNTKKPINIEFLLNRFKEENIPVTSIIQNINTKKTNVILSPQNISLFGKKYIEDTIDGLIFRIYPNSFYQVNPVQMEKIYHTVLDHANLQGSETVYDLYCGIGTISLLLAQKCKKVYGMEVVEQAIQSAKENASLNQIHNAEFICSKVEDSIENLLQNSEKPDVVVLDPARKGCEEKVLHNILQAQPSKIIYVSCNPSTLARDLKILLQTEKYKIDAITPFDMFCHTMHVETVALLSKLESTKKD